MSTHAHTPRDTYICYNPQCRRTSARPGRCHHCGYNKFLNPDRGKPKPKPVKEATP